MKKSYIIITVLLLSLQACNKRLVVDIASPTAISVEGYYNSPANLLTALNGVYGTLRPRYDLLYKLTEIPSDNTISTPSVDADTGPLDKFSWTPTDNNFRNVWNQGYATISAANTLIDLLKGSQVVDSATRSAYLGEARFIRALTYFDLVRLFGNVPLVLKKIDSDQEALNYSQATSEAVYAQVMDDLDFAASALPSQYPAEQLGRATSWAAKAIKGKVLLTLKRYLEAALMLKEVVSSGSFTLLDNYSQVFSNSNKFNKEIIFSVNYNTSSLPEGSNFALNFYPKDATDLLRFATPRGLNQGSTDLYTTFEASDLRKVASIASYKDNVSYYTVKYQDQPTSANQGSSNWIVIRYSDVLLMLAEAINEQAFDSEAFTYLNLIRTRAGLAEKSADNVDETLRVANQTQFRLAVEQDRRKELCFEGHRWFDLVRTGRMVEVMKAQFSANKDKLKQLNLANITPERALFPIPFRELSLNSKLIQNPGY